MKIHIEITETDLKELIAEKIENLMDCEVNTKDIKILVKSKQNFKSEWEEANFKAEYVKN